MIQNGRSKVADAFTFFLRSRYENATPNFVLGALCIIGCPVQLRREVFSRLHSSSSTHICLTLRRLLTFYLTLTR